MTGQIHSPPVSLRDRLPQSSLLYEDEYILLALISAPDVGIMFFYLQFGGHLFNAFVDSVITDTGIYGLLMFKLTLFALVVFGCETLGYRKPVMGRRVVNIVNLLALLSMLAVSIELLRLWV